MEGVERKKLRSRRSFTAEYKSEIVELCQRDDRSVRALRATGPAAVAAYLREHGAWAEGIAAMTNKAITAAADQTVVAPAEALTASLVARLAADLLELDRQIHDLYKLLAERFSQHWDAPVDRPRPGFGPVLGAQLLADTGGDLVDPPA